MRAAVWVAVATGLFILCSAGIASAETRSLKLYFLHTKERAEITYKVNGKYIDSGLRKINRLLRDWRRDEPTKMDPKLLDLVWEVYSQSGSRDYIHVISAYRSPATNSMLRKRSKGVAKNSQHTLGKALDFFLPDVKLSKLRAIGLKVGNGGVGYYPTSGSPFVHMDTGRVRHWPRMSRKELVQLFPDGKTLHIPTDGKPLPGYERALASYKGRRANSPEIQIAKAEDVRQPNFFERWAKRLQEQQREPNEDETEASTLTVAASTRSEPARDTGTTSGEPITVAELRPEDGSVFSLPEIVPVPSRRPDLRLAGFALAGAVVPGSPGKTDVSGSAGSRVASLTPGEIEDLRRSAIADDPAPLPSARPARTIIPESEIEDRLAPMDGSLPGPEPGEALAYAPAENELRGPRPTSEIPGAIAQTRALRMAVAESAGAGIEPRIAGSAAEIPTVTPTSAADLRLTGTIPAPVERPNPGPRKETLELALAAPDPGNAARAAISSLIDASSRLTELEEHGFEDNEAMVSELTTNSSPAPAQWRRISDTRTPASVRSLAMGSRYLGQWALVSQRSLDEIGELSAPIYGRHATVGDRNEMAFSGFVKVAATYMPGSLSKQ